MIRCLTFVVLTLLAPFAPAAEPTSPLTQTGDARVSIVGTQACSMCDFGIGEDCCLGIRVADMRFVVEGPACDKLFDNRHSGDKTFVTGTLFIKHGAIYLDGETHEAKETPRAPAFAEGTLREQDGRLLLRSDKTDIELVGDQLASARPLVGQMVFAAGPLHLDERGRVSLAADTIRPAKETK